MESYLSHQHTQSYVSVLSHLSHVEQVGQFCGILPVPPAHSILCVCPIPSVPLRTSGTVLCNPTCPTSTLNPVCVSVLSHLSHVGQVGKFYGSYLSHQHTQSYVSVLSHLSHVGRVGQSYGILPVPPTHSIVCVCPISLVLCFQYL